jgi:hypothetical protein
MLPDDWRETEFHLEDTEAGGGDQAGGGDRAGDEYEAGAGDEAGDARDPDGRSDSRDTDRERERERDEGAEGVDAHGS